MRARISPAGLAIPLFCLGLAACASVEPPAGPNRCYERGMAEKSSCMPEALRRLDVLPAGQPVTVTVDARCEWNPTGVILERGARYNLKVTRFTEDWQDWRADSDLETGWSAMYGWGGRQLQHWARAPRFPMYALIGAQGREERSFFVVGRETNLTAAAGEELLLFANDWPGRYNNNRGCVQLQIQKLSP
jgi:hypothetical protein